MDTYNYGSDSELLTQTGGTAAEDALLGGLSGGMLIFILVLSLLSIVGLWKIFTKAGKPGWASIIPFYNYYVLLQIVGRPSWWMLLLLLAFIPFVGWIPALIVGVIVTHDLSKSFGKDIGWTVFMILLSPIAYLMLGFGDAKYQGPSALKAAGGAGAAPTGASPAQDGTAPQAAPVSPAVATQPIAPASVAGPAAPGSDQNNGTQPPAPQV